MAEMEDPNKFDVKYLFTGAGVKDWYKALGNGWRIGVIIFLLILLVAGALQIKNFFFPKKSGNINHPTAIALPFSKVDKIDQTSTQILVEEKTWELGIGLGAISYDNKSGAFGGAWLKKKW